MSKGKQIEERPKEILTREEFGHWEMDSVVGKQGISKNRMVVLTERKTRKELIYKVKDGTAESVVTVIDDLEKRYGNKFKKIFKTITVDNGSEFKDGAGIEYNSKGEHRIDVYYCNAYASYERGTNENQNKLIRRWIPKGTNFDNRPPAFIKKIEEWINNYPRKLFNWETSQVQWERELAFLD